MKFVSTIIRDIRRGEHIDVYLTMLICVIVVTLDVFGIVQLQIVMTAILATLTLLSFGTLATRKTLRELDESLRKLESDRRASAFLKTRDAYPPLDKTIATARHAYFLGPSIINVMSWSGYLHSEKLNRQGAVLRLLLLDPNCSALESAAKCMYEPLEDLRKDIMRSLGYVERMIQDGIQAGMIEVRQMAVYPGYSMVLLDPEESDGRIFVEFIGYHTGHVGIHRRPHIELTRRDDGEWYEHFLEEYNQLWEASRVCLTSRQTT